MICPKCKSIVYGIACAACATRASRAEMERIQATYLVEAASGQRKLWVRRRAGSGLWHTLMFGSRTTFCGSTISHQFVTEECPWADLQKLPILCISCRAEMNRVLEGAH